MMVRALLITAALLLPAPTLAQESKQTPPAAPSLFVGYDPSPAWPHGRLHPDAPPETEQFAFMVGEFDCIDEMRQGDGSWLRFRAIWNAHWFLNGYGIQDEYWTPQFFTSNIRIFDPASGKWQVTFFRMPGYQSGGWQGVQESDRMVMRKGKTTGPGLTFFNISEAGFDWNSGGENPGWKSSCKRRRHGPTP
jgi:hypothetical protein